MVLGGSHAAYILRFSSRNCHLSVARCGHPAGLSLEACHVPGGPVRPDGHPAGPSLEACHILAGVDTSCPLDEGDTPLPEHGAARAEEVGSQELASGLIGSLTTG